ncbi:MAG: cation diffusion facilitator family transporter, partial [Eubacterium sp.]|nr:cation diffusion facilitator family transporter [Eubacterium sp.]
MSNLIIKLFIKDGDAKDLKTREKYGTLSGGVGIFCNLILCIFKFIVGALSNSVSITADAVNNLSDASSNVVTIFGAKMAGKPVDEDHPFGHGRMEYISALIVSFFIFLMGFELGKSSIEKIIHPEDVKFSAATLIVLLASIAVKLWMAFFNNRLFRITNNVNMKAVKQDSLNDCIATAATIAALLISSFTPFKRADGIIGVIVAIIVIIAGIGIVKDIISNLLGKAPDPELVKQIEDIMLAENDIAGVHDLIVHDYGPGRIIASAHAEVPCNVDVLKLHDMIDNVEKLISKRLNIMICIHMDPVVVDDEKINEYKTVTAEIIKKYDENFSFHDFRVVEGKTHTNFIFDLVIPHQYKKEN